MAPFYCVFEGHGLRGGLSRSLRETLQLFASLQATRWHRYSSAPPPKKIWRYSPSVWDENVLSDEASTCAMCVHGAVEGRVGRVGGMWDGFSVAGSTYRVLTPCLFCRGLFKHGQALTTCVHAAFCLPYTMGFLASRMTRNVRTVIKITL